MKCRVKAFTNPGSAEIAYAALLRLLPNWLFDPLDVLVASRTYTMLKKFRTMANTIGNDIIQKAVDNREGLEEKDIVGILGWSFCILVLEGEELICLQSLQSSIHRFEEVHEPARYDVSDGVRFPLHQA